MGLGFQLGQSLLQLQAPHIHCFVGIFQHGHGFLTEIATPHALKVHASRAGRITRHHHEGRNVFTGQRPHAQHGIGPNMAKLVRSGKAGKDYIVCHMNMPGHSGMGGEDIVIANHAIMSHMHIAHKEVTAANARDALILNGAAMERATFTNVIVIANFQPGWLSFVFLVLAVLTDRGKLKHSIALTNSGGAFDTDMGMHHGA